MVTVETTTKTDRPMDFRAKRQELLGLWERMFKLCDALVASAEKGEKDLKASMVKELNGFLKLSKDILDTAEQEAEQEQLRMDFGEEVKEEVFEDIKDTYDYADFQAKKMNY